MRTLRMRNLCVLVAAHGQDATVEAREVVRAMNQASAKLGGEPLLDFDSDPIQAEYIEDDPEELEEQAPPRLVVFVDEGAVHTIMADRPGVKVLLVDYDTEGQVGEDIKRVTDSSGEDLGEARVEERSADLDLEGVEHFWKYLSEQEGDER